MDDFDYMAPESSAAWLEGHGDGRFERYERFYQSERAIDAAGFDLEKTNEGYGKWASEQRSRLVTLLAEPWVGRIAIALFAIFMGARLVPELARLLPEATGFGLVVAFIGLRIFHRRRRQRR
ncbi:hypothetical protein [Paraburkholderia ribeironis]|nr:hypothetical protein [Paraburkholderia ribeironis]